MTKTRKKITVRDMCLIAIFAALTAVLAQISIPMPLGVPLTLQTLAVALTGIVLGAKRGFFASLVYVLMGTVGLPVFSNFTGGVGAVFSPVCGFILSFPIMSLVIGFGFERFAKVRFLWLILGVAVNYLCGIVMFSVVTSNTLATAVTACMLPFIPTDIVKMLCAYFLGTKLKKIQKLQL